MPDIRLTDRHQNRRLTGTRDDIDDVPGDPGKLWIFADPRPADINDAITATKLVEVIFTYPCGTVTARALTLTFDGPAVGIAPGHATWAMFVDGNDIPVMDCSVTSLAGTALVRMSILDITPGLPIESISAVIT